MPPSRALPITLASVFVFGFLTPAATDALKDFPKRDELPDYDQPPRPIKIVKPKYPKDALAKKIHGVVEVEILIDASGLVARARVVKSVPGLDEAALDTVERWRFYPATKKGRPVATVARAPVIFEIDAPAAPAPQR
jgi:TonB family protein